MQYTALKLVIFSKLYCLGKWGVASVFLKISGQPTLHVACRKVTAQQVDDVRWTSNIFSQQFLYLASFSSCFMTSFYKIHQTT